jgi:hypothetical protein
MEIRSSLTNKHSTKKLKINNSQFMMFSTLKLWFHQVKENQKMLMLDALFIREQWIKFTILKLNKADNSITKF